MKLLLVCPNWVGDAVMATPAIRSLRGQFPSARIDAIAPRSVTETLAGNPWIDRFLVREEIQKGWRTPWMGAARSIRRERYDLAVLFPGSFVTAMECWLGRVKRRVGYDRELRGAMLTDRLPAGRTLAGYQPSPIIDYYLRLAGHLGADISSRRMELRLTEPDMRSAASLWAKLRIGGHEPVVCMNPGSAFGPAKRWPASSFAELARQMVDRHRLRVIVLCGPAERDLARSIAVGSERAHAVYSLADEEVSIGLTKAVVARSRLLVTTDSGPRHFAPAFGIPVVSLFGPTHIEWTQTYYPEESQLQRKVPCGPCQKRVCPEGHHRCMKELTVAEVFAASTRALRLPCSLEKAG